MEDNIEKIRKDAVKEIKEKAKKNPGYLHPCNKERLEDMKRLGFVVGNDFTCWMQQNGIMKNPTDVERKKRERSVENAGCKTWPEYKDKKAQEAGFKDQKEQLKEWRHKTGRNLPAEDNPDCPSHFGDFTENLMIQTFEGAIKMPPNNPGFDWMCKKGQKIDHKGACLRYWHKSPRWQFNIRHNSVADWFILSAWDDRDSLSPLHVWAFHKNDMVRGRKFWRRTAFTITNTQKGLKELEKWEVTGRLDKLKELFDKR